MAANSAIMSPKAILNLSILACYNNIQFPKSLNSRECVKDMLDLCLIQEPDVFDVIEKCTNGWFAYRLDIPVLLNVLFRFFYRAETN